MYEMIKTTDVFIQNWRPGAADRLGLGEAKLRDINPNLIYCSISGFGPSGPYSDRRVYDPIIQGLTGHPAIQMSQISLSPIWFVTLLRINRRPTPQPAITAALFARDRGAADSILRCR